MKKVVITGGTGYLGKHLVNELHKAYKIVILTRNPHKYKNMGNVLYEEWDNLNTIEEKLEEAYAIINLAGENIGSKKWTQDQKKKILNSRITAAQTIKKSIELCNNKPKVWIQASATGYYGVQNHTVFDEGSPKGEGSFLSDVCYEWEKPINALDSHIRKLIIRTGVVLSLDSSLVKQLIMSFKFGVKSIPGNGGEYLPWIHIEDEVRAIKFLLSHEECSGIFNLTSPESSSMQQIINEIGKYKNSIISLHIPKFFLKLIFGKEMTEEIILTNQKIYPKKLLDAQFQFKYTNIQEAISQIIQGLNKK